MITASGASDGNRTRVGETSQDGKYAISFQIVGSREIELAACRRGYVVVTTLEITNQHFPIRCL